MQAWKNLATTERAVSSDGRRSPRSWACYVVFPLTLLGGLGLTAGLIEAGLDPALGLVGASLGTMVVVATSERLIPFREDWNVRRGDLLTDILHSLLSSFLTIEVVKIGLVAALLPLAGASSAAWGSALWPSEWSIWGQLGLAALLIEFGCYWIHRASHEIDFLWRFHSVHHSPERLYWLNAGRDHPIGAALTTLASLPLAIVAGVPEPCMALYFALQSIHGLFQHANIDVRLGPLNWIFSMAELHRWHHSTKLEEANANYGLTLIFWDVIFGTRHLPGPDGPAEIGIESMPDFPRDYVRQLAVPFRWRNGQRQSLEAERRSA